MTRIFRSLGLVMVVAAMAAVTAPVAKAETGALTTPIFPSIVTGEQLGGVTFDIGEMPKWAVSCESKLDATLFGPTDPVTFQPTYANCGAPPFTPVTVTMNGCDYTVGFGRPGTTGQPIGTGTMHAWINCPAGQQIQIHVYLDGAMHAANISTCTYDIGPQGPVPAGIYHNTAGAGMIPDVDATINARFTAVSTIEPGGPICGGNPLTQHLPITLTGNHTLRGFNDFNGVEGPQIPLHVG